MTGPYFNLVQEYKAKMEDLDPENCTIQLHKYDICQLKYDGWWCILKIVNHEGVLISSGGEIRKEFNTPRMWNTTILCEWIYGTNAAQTSELFDRLVLHDCLSLEGIDLKNTPYSHRYNCLEEIHYILVQDIPGCIIAESFSSKIWQELWSDKVLGQGFEGLVFKNSTSEFPMLMGKMKPEVDEDYVAMAFNEGQNRLTGTLGAIVGGLYRNGILTKTCTVGGGFSDEQRDQIWANRDQLQGKVFRAYGKLKFSSGALRGPQFDDWRDDKDPLMCKAQP